MRFIVVCEAGHLTVDSFKYPSLALFRTKYLPFSLLSSNSLLPSCLSLWNFAAGYKDLPLFG